ncbi:PspC domain-containing protein [Mangrovibacterium marinum]|uniref:Phage shock protein C (PspC) family protein n=1 Tax=Mangrovibacterium marinum TaxID=1639118 RepID=A0A2T5C2Z9_9BACT|nr:PspC domain-containing protein [Mangrovibacterium marinum]PTN09067.1 phage shock protein C (PspC) family protein [Mangrovibacterium marinum]
MKKTFTINISGSVFHIEEDAYEKLKSYLQMLTNHFGSDEDGREILQDIEARIAELFTQKMEDEEKDVVLDSWVDEVMERMGKPEDFLEAEGLEAEEEPAGQGAGTARQRVKRRMYRDPDHRVLGGVCSGMGAYFNMDPVILRVLNVILFFATGGTWGLVYLVLWIAVPKAKTTAQKLEMRGQEATVSNIEKSIKEEVAEVKESYNRFRSSESYNKGRENVNRFGEFIFQALKVILKVLGVILGIVMMIVGFVGLLAFLISMVVGHSVITGAPWAGHFAVPDVAQFLIAPASVTVLMIAIAFLVGIPLLVILYVGTKIVFRYKSNNKVILLSGLGVWLLAFVTTILVSLGQLKDYSERSTITQSVTLQQQNFNTLALKLTDDDYRFAHKRSLDLDRMKVVKKDGESVLLGRPHLDVERSNTTDFVLVVKKKSRGASEEVAGKEVQDIVYNFNQKDSTLYFDPYYILKNDQRWLGQEVDMTLKVPEGKAIYLSDEMVKIIYDIENVSNTWDGDMVGKSWVMTPDGLAVKENYEQTKTE